MRLEMSHSSEETMNAHLADSLAIHVSGPEHESGRVVVLPTPPKSDKYKSKSNHAPRRSVRASLGRAPMSAGVSVCVDNCSYVIEEKTILSDISCTLASGTMTALMGPSGAGKSSLLNLMMQNLPKKYVKGTVTCNGTTLTRRTMKLLSNFVHQDDVLLPSLTVRQQLAYSAALRIPLSEDVRKIFMSCYYII